MANTCNYEIHVRGTKKAALALYSMIPAYDEKYISDEYETDEGYVVKIEGDCKWSLDSYCEEKPDVQINLDNFTEDEIRDEDRWTDHWYMTLRQKSEVLDVEIQAYSWSRESEFECFEHYRKGKKLSFKREMPDIPLEVECMEMFPLWYRDDFPTYQEFCDEVPMFSDLSDISSIPESEWAYDEEQGAYVVSEDAWEEFAWEFRKNAYPSHQFKFDF